MHQPSPNLADPTDRRVRLLVFLYDVASYAHPSWLKHHRIQERTPASAKNRLLLRFLSRAHTNPFAPSVENRVIHFPWERAHDIVFLAGAHALRAVLLRFGKLPYLEDRVRQFVSLPLSPPYMMYDPVVSAATHQSIYRCGASVVLASLMDPDATFATTGTAPEVLLRERLALTLPHRLLESRPNQFSVSNLQRARTVVAFATSYSHSHVETTARST